ncbi:DUF2461 domain-containing protein [Rhodopirellula bahusiensis]|uniref:DUF2461 domain-containing protein n=1 Tax=Rhodopirellula bahusiensis TaxID=2014065 RepID=UPI003267510A
MTSPIQPELFHFLEDLAGNNNRDWFAENKSRYEDEVRQPALELIRQLAVPLKRSAPMLRVIDKTQGGSLMRIYRDTRFSKDKTPYKTNVGISLRHDACFTGTVSDDIHAPGGYVHLSAEECFVGMGAWRPQRQSLAAIRATIAENPKAWRRARDAKSFRTSYELGGDRLKTSPRDYDRDHPMIEDLRRIDFIGIASLKPEEITADDSVARITQLIRDAKPFMRFLCDAVDVPY